MGTLTAGSIISKAVLQLNDMSSVRWTRAELLTWLSDAQRTMALAVPQATATLGLVTTVAGVKQSIPSDGWILLRANRNMGSSGTTPGRILQLVTHEDLTKNNPTWDGDAATGIATVYAYSPVFKSVFWIYPPADSSGNKIEVEYSQLPIEIVTEATVISVLDVYEPVLLDYVLSKACAKDAEYAAGAQLATAYMTSFYTAIGVISKEDAR